MKRAEQVGELVPVGDLDQARVKDAARAIVNSSDDGAKKAARALLSAKITEITAVKPKVSNAEIATMIGYTGPAGEAMVAVLRDSREHDQLADYLADLVREYLGPTEFQVAREIIHNSEKDETRLKAIDTLVNAANLKRGNFTTIIQVGGQPRELAINKRDWQAVEQEDGRVTLLHTPTMRYATDKSKLDPVCSTHGCKELRYSLEAQNNIFPAQGNSGAGDLP